MIHETPNCEWGTWKMTHSACVSHIRFSKCGEYIEKMFEGDAPMMRSTARNQADCWEQGLTPLKVYAGTAPESYISMAAIPLPDHLADPIFDHYFEIGNDSFAIGSPEELQEACAWFDGEEDEFVDEVISQVFENSLCTFTAERLVRMFLELGLQSDLDFSDCHWQNVGIFDGGLVCIDFDTEYNYEASMSILA